MHEAGSVLKIDRGIFFHYGIADGMGMVIHNSKKRMMVTHDNYEEFSGGKEIIVSEIVGVNAFMAVENARKYIGLSYNLFQENCEHFVRTCHGLEKESTQIQKAVIVAAGLAVGVKVKNPVIKTIGIAGALGAFFTPQEKNPLKLAVLFALLAGGIALLASTS